MSASLTSQKTPLAVYLKPALAALFASLMAAFCISFLLLSLARNVMGTTKTPAGNQSLIQTETNQKRADSFVPFMSLADAASGGYEVLKK